MSDHGPGPAGVVLMFLSVPTVMFIVGLVCWAIFNDEVVR